MEFTIARNIKGKPKQSSVLTKSNENTSRLGIQNNRQLREILKECLKQSTAFFLEN